MTERLLFLLYNTYYAHVAYNVTAKVRDFYHVMISAGSSRQRNRPELSVRDLCGQGYRCRIYREKFDAVI